MRLPWSQYIDGWIFPDDAARAIDVKERQFRRLVKAFREEGIISIVHGNHGKTPPNATSAFTKHSIIKLYKGRYLDLNLVHFREKLEENHPEIEVAPSYSTIRNIFIKEEVHFPNIVKKPSVHRMRKRYAREGMMVQIDGSPHRWIYGHQSFCLTAAIDDATGKIVGAKFTKTETTFASMDVVESIIEKYGKFQMLYSDKAGIYGGGKRDGYRNMNRAMRELEIILIQANTPQAKGRVERLFKTLQSRLTSEIMLEKISTIEEANIYLEETFIKFNIRFGKIAEDLETAYKPLLLG